MLELMDVRTKNLLSTLPSTASDDLVETTSNIIDAINGIKINTIKIGYNLARIRDDQLYITAGFESEIEYAEKIFGFKKSAAYSFMKLSDLFLNHEGGFISQKYEDYSTSQLEAMTPIPQHSIDRLIEEDKITPDMTVKAIKAVVKNEKERLKNIGKPQKAKNQKSENQKKASENKDTDLYVIKIGVNSLGNPYIKLIDNNDSPTEDIVTKINTTGLDDMINRITNLLNTQANVIIEKNKSYQDAIARYKEATAALSNEELADIMES